MATIRAGVITGRDGDLVERLRAGDEDAYRWLLESHGERMLSVARGVLKSEEDALDARQDALLSLVLSLDRFAGEALLSTWLHRVVVNACLMRLRSRRRRGPTVSLDELGGEASPLAHPCRGSAPALWEGEARVHRAQVSDRLRRRLGALRPAYRTVFLLRDVHELPTRQVAAMLGISENAVKVRLHRARREARGLLEAGAEPARRPRG